MRDIYVLLHGYSIRICHFIGNWLSVCHEVGADRPVTPASPSSLRMGPIWFPPTYLDESYAAHALYQPTQPVDIFNFDTFSSEPLLVLTSNVA